MSQRLRRLWWPGAALIALMLRTGRVRAQSVRVWVAVRALAELLAAAPVALFAVGQEVADPLLYYRRQYYALLLYNGCVVLQLPAGAARCLTRLLVSQSRNDLGQNPCLVGALVPRGFFKMESTDSTLSYLLAACQRDRASRGCCR